MAFSEWKHSWFLEERNPIQREGKSCSLQHYALELRRKLVFNAALQKGRKPICSPLYNLPDWASQHPHVEVFLALPLHMWYCRPSVLSWAAFVDGWLSHKETAFTQSSVFKLSTVPNPCFFTGLWFFQVVIWILLLYSVLFFVRLPSLITHTCINLKQADCKAGPKICFILLLQCIFKCCLCYVQLILRNVTWQLSLQDSLEKSDYLPPMATVS